MVSVAMTSYNGEKYIKNQIESILKNLTDEDELVISDDGSTDNTLSIIQEFDDHRIKLVEGPNDGINANFENAIRNCIGDYIFLCDQDDEWMDGKVEMVLDVFTKQKCIVVMHDAIVVDREDNILYPSLFKKRNPRNGVWYNIIKNSYHGCCMAFDKRIKEDILPIPHAHFYHDQWIGIIAESTGGKSIFITDILMKYYRYSTNNSNFMGDTTFVRIRNRIELIWYYFQRQRRINR